MFGSVTAACKNRMLKLCQIKTPRLAKEARHLLGTLALGFGDYQVCLGRAEQGRAGPGRKVEKRHGELHRSMVL